MHTVKSHTSFQTLHVFFFTQTLVFMINTQKSCSFSMLCDKLNKDQVPSISRRPAVERQCSVQASSPFGGVVRIHARTTCERRCKRILSQKSESLFAG